MCVNIYVYMCVCIKFWGFFNCSWICCSSSRNVVGRWGTLPNSKSIRLNSLRQSKYAKPVSRGVNCLIFDFHDRQRFDTNRTPPGGGCPEKGPKCRLLYVIGCGPQKLHGVPVWIKAVPHGRSRLWWGGIFFLPSSWFPSWWKIHKLFLVTVVQMKSSVNVWRIDYPDCC